MTNYSENVLVIKHIPNELLHDEKVEFLQYFGATDVKLLEPSGRRPCTAFARFETKYLAQAVLNKLHQYELFGNRLCVEFARGSDSYQALESVNTKRAPVSSEDVPAPKQLLDDFLHKITSWTSIAGFSQPPPHHVRYLYPPPTAKVLSNISHALASSPKFYTQTLHLMNKLNLPCPFIEPYPIDSGLLVDTAIPEKSQVSTEESEIESDNDENFSLQNKEIVPNIKRRSRPTLKISKKPKLSQIPCKTSSQPLKPAEVFESVESLASSKKIQLKVTTDLSALCQDAQKNQVLEPSGFELINPAPELKPSEDDSTLQNSPKPITDIISIEELSANKITYKDQKLLPVFKNYTPGIPSCRLYIKNIAKNVTESDLERIYRRYFSPDLKSEQGVMFDIRLMQEGRMKGQAFITLQTVELAQQALQDTNGFILKSKPMVVQYARSSKSSST